MPVFVFDKSRNELSRTDGVQVKLRPQSLDVLKLLLDHSGQVVSKELILDQVWGNLQVTDDSVTQCITDIRRALGAEHRKLLQTVPKKGYRLNTTVDENGLALIKVSLDHHNDHAGISSNLSTIKAPDSIPGKSSQLLAALKAPLRRARFSIFILTVSCALIIWFVFTSSSGRHADRGRVLSSHGAPTVAILPFRNTTTSKIDHYYFDGITEDVISALSRFSSLRVMSFDAVSRFTNLQYSVGRLSKEFDVHYVVSGSVRQLDERIRITVQLIDTESSHVLWSQDYDESLQDLFLLQESIANRIVASLATKVSKFETDRAISVPTKYMAAYELVLSGRSKLRHRNKRLNLEARTLFENALDIDPTYALAYIELGETYIEEAMLGWTEWPAQANEKALELAKRAEKIDGQDFRIIGFLALVHLRMGRFKLAQKELDRAFMLNSNDPRLHKVQALLETRTDKFEEAIERMEYALKVDPYLTPSWEILGMAYYMTNRYEDAILTIKRGLTIDSSLLFGYIVLTAAQVEAGEIEAAGKSAEEVRQRSPFFNSAVFSEMSIFSTQSHKEKITKSLRAAGLD